MADFTGVIQSARNAFKTGRTKDIAWRKSQLKAVDRMLTENEEVFLSALKADLNKPVQDSIISEVDFLKNDVIGLLRNIDTWTQECFTEKSVVTLLDTPSIFPEPYGVVLNIGAWNYPLQLALAPTLPAIAAGNCVIIKPSEMAPATAKALEDLIPAYLDKDCIKVVCGGVPETTSLLSQRFDYIFYTGSTAVGRIIGEAANKHLTPCTLELGGKSPAYIDGTGNLEVICKRLMWGKFSNSGQICVAPDYILCSKATEKRVVLMMRKLLADWYGHDAELSSDYCRIVSGRHLTRLQGLLDKTKGCVEIGGKSSPGSKFLEPTVVSDVSLEDALMSEEIFGPILPIVSLADTPQQAVDIINQREKPLALYVFSDSEEVVKLFKENTSSGGLLFNDTIMHLSIEQLPFGGVGESGMGAYHGKFGFDTFTHYKPVLRRDLGWLGEKLGEFRYPPYKPTDLGYIRMLTKNRLLPSFGWLQNIAFVGLGAAIGYLSTFYLARREKGF